MNAFVLPHNSGTVTDSQGGWAVRTEWPVTDSEAGKGAQLWNGTSVCSWPSPTCSHRSRLLICLFLLSVPASALNPFSLFYIQAPTCWWRKWAYIQLQKTRGSKEGTWPPKGRLDGTNPQRICCETPPRPWHLAFGGNLTQTSGLLGILSWTTIASKGE